MLKGSLKVNDMILEFNDKSLQGLRREDVFKLFSEVTIIVSAAQ